jgi:hypothetical protein
LIVEILERNEDTFARPLTFDHDDDAGDAVSLEDGRLLATREVAESTDAAFLSGRAIALDDPSVPLARCRLVVLHRTTYEGTGREGGALRVFGFPTSRGKVPLGLAPVPDRIDHDPVRDPMSFLGRLGTVRVPGGPGGALEVDGSGAVAVRAFGEERALGPGGSTLWAPAPARLRVTVRPFPASALEIDGVPAGAPSEELAAAEDHGEVGFSTRWTVVNHGPLPLSIVEAGDGEGEDLR